MKRSLLGLLSTCSEATEKVLKYYKYLEETLGSTTELFWRGVHSTPERLAQ